MSVSRKLSSEPVIVSTTNDAYPKELGLDLITRRFLLDEEPDIDVYAQSLMLMMKAHTERIMQSGASNPSAASSDSCSSSNNLADRGSDPGDTNDQDSMIQTTLQEHDPVVYKARESDSKTSLSMTNSKLKTPVVRRNSI
ncbi:hypothetical protein M409DRAFT_24552 [Zasmidium cellare ATCC 36951]|uniref:Uncharacterized protein n=1 Tax=Zasmidium cellare ATCC 36951 TaxID=1080233 RepID=A0A6A6CIE1_ZASCE|nr:uncharacterized protein M409DRAFT_24552 [Zasmidium cellare ATCC 36951]KAF2165166.1 hypothetical protein M409DRAFT_24552 [Zasmidium cellare ATCC 36951]